MNRGPQGRLWQLLDIWLVLYRHGKSMIHHKGRLSPFSCAALSHLSHVLQRDDGQTTMVESLFSTLMLRLQMLGSPIFSISFTRQQMSVCPQHPSLLNFLLQWNENQLVEVSVTKEFFQLWFFCIVLEMSLRKRKDLSDVDFQVGHAKTVLSFTLSGILSLGT